MQTAQTVLDSDNQQRQPEFMIQFGSKRVQDAISDAKFATCLAEDVRQSLQVIDSNSALFFDIYFVLLVVFFFSLIYRVIHRLIVMFINLDINSLINI